jgi:Na+-translocating ferredoxin:NAD+ oxidoreductase RnfD subunit
MRVYCSARLMIQRCVKQTLCLILGDAAACLLLLRVYGGGMFAAAACSVPILWDVCSLLLILTKGLFIAVPCSLLLILADVWSLLHCRQGRSRFQVLLHGRLQRRHV